MSRILAWHFLPSDGNLRYGKWRNPLVRPGVVYVHRGPVELCKRGLHASVRAIDALTYAPGPVVCRVECWDRVQHDADKLVCGRRKVLWIADATRVLHEFALWCAEQARMLVPWDSVWGDRGSAWATACNSARNAAWASAKTAAWAGRSATWDITWNNACNAQDAELDRLLLALGPEGVKWK